jgi:hypothetical protein
MQGYPRVSEKSILSAHFDEIPCWPIDSFLALHSHEYDIFVPSGTPEKVMHPQCFRSRREIGVKWIGTQ